MRTVRQYLSLGGLALLLAVTPALAQEIKSDYDKSNDFTRCKRYAFGKNYLLTHQASGDQALIDKALAETLDGSARNSE